MKEGDIIKDYNHLPLGKYMDIQKVIQSADVNALEDEMQMQVKFISILTDMTEDEVLNLPIGEYKVLASHSKFLEDTPAIGRRLANTYICGDFTLIPTKDARKVTTAQYIDFQTYCKMGFEEHYVEVLSVLLIPKGKRYNTDYDVVEVQDAIRRDLSVTDAVTIFGFFLKSSAQSIASTLNYCKKMVKKMPPSEQREVLMKKILEAETLSPTSGDGCHR